MTNCPPFWRTKIAGGEIKVAGICVLAEDTGRVLMLQRAFDSTKKDPAAGTWEFAGGHIEAGETPLQAGKREWSEETGMSFPRGRLQSYWDSGIYRGYVWVIPKEAQLKINQPHSERKMINPDDPDGDAIETVAWWDPELMKGNPSVRPELRAAMRKVQAAIYATKAATSPPFWHHKLAGLETIRVIQPMLHRETRRILDDQIRDQVKASLSQLATRNDRVQQLATLGQKAVDAIQPSTLVSRLPLIQNSMLTKPVKAGRRGFLKYTAALAAADRKTRETMVNNVAGPMRASMHGVTSPETAAIAGGALSLQRNKQARRLGRGAVGAAAAVGGVTAGASALSYMFGNRS